MDEILEVSLAEREGVPVVRAVGEVDVSSAPALREKLNDATTGSSRVIVDLSDVTFLDSTGIGVLISALKRVRERDASGNVELVVTRPQLLKVLDVTGLNAVFAISASVEDALAR